ncbi:hypothetical protein [Streptomyces sp. BPTC-684]|nr:hypothetical protein [Streptomyces sp. BPTC-684]WHM40886.1 hypothetical protein QIY60_31070 [Streptomyces sp. BPTC-684]
MPAGPNSSAWRSGELASGRPPAPRTVVFMAWSGRGGQRRAENEVAETA